MNELIPEIDGWILSDMTEEEFNNYLTFNREKDPTCKTESEEFEKWNTKLSMVSYTNGDLKVGIILKDNIVKYCSSNLEDDALCDFLLLFINNFNGPLTLISDGYNSRRYNLFLKVGKKIGVNYFSRANLKVFSWKVKR
jgi:hypothetical protein